MTTVYEYAFIKGPPYELLLTVRKSQPLAHLVPGARIRAPKDVPEEEGNDEMPPMLDYIVVEILHTLWAEQEMNVQRIAVKIKPLE